MNELSRNLQVERIELTDEELQEHFVNNPYKLEIINDKLEVETHLQSTSRATGMTYV